MTTRREFLSSMAAAGLAAQPVFRERAIRSLFRANAIALFQVEGIDNVKLGAWLLNQHRIVNTPIVHPDFKGIRITPNVYTTLDEIDIFADKVLDAVKKGIPI